MEEWQKNVFKAEKTTLYKLMKLNSTLRDYLVSKNVLSDDEVKTLNSHLDDTKKLDCLFEILHGKENGYHVLASGLNENNQSGAFKILFMGAIKEGIHNMWIKSSQKATLLKESIDETALKYIRKELQGTIVDQEARLKFIETVCNWQHEKTALELINQEIPKLDYYLPRTLSKPTFVSEGLFKNIKPNIPDKFVYYGMSRAELSTIVCPQSTFSSTKQLCRFEPSCRHIYLESKIHWNIISQHTKVPVHLVCYDSKLEKYKIEKSTEMSTFVRAFLLNSDEKEENVGEEEFVRENILGQENSRVCVCDSPGMGKTFLLARLSELVGEIQPHTVTIFYRLSTMVGTKLINQMEKNTLSAEETLCKLIEAFVSHKPTDEQLLCRLVLKELFINQKEKIVWFLDGYDEITEENQKIVLDCFKKLQSQQNLNICISSRKNYKQELESELGACSYDILPFTKANQLDFFVKVWSRELENKKVLDINRLKTFAKQISSKVISKLNQKERDFLGIPLQCRMLATVFVKAAEAFCMLDKTQEYDFMQHSFFDSAYQVYQKFFLTKFNEQDSKQTRRVTEMKQYHVYKALRLLFPKLADNYANLKHVNVNKAGDEYLAIGILEKYTKVDGTKVTEFVHRSFADYLVAEFLAEYVVEWQKPVAQKDWDHCSEMIKCVMLQVLKGTFGQTLQLYHSKIIGSIISTQFQYNTTVYFLNARFANIEFLSVEKFVSDEVLKIVQSKLKPRLWQLLLRSIHNNYVYIFRFVQILLTQSTDKVASLEKSYQIGNGKQHRVELILMLAIAARSERPMLKQCFLFFDKCFKYNLKQNCRNISDEPLHKAISRGNFELVEYFSKTSYKLGTLDQIQLCLNNTYKENIVTVESKIEILELLLQRATARTKRTVKAKGLVNFSKVHPDLLQELVEKYESHIDAHKNERNVFHFVADYMDPNDVHNFYTFIISKNTSSSSTTFRLDTKQWCNILFYVLAKCKNVKPETLDLILETNKISPDACVKNSVSLIEHAVELNRIGVVKMLVERNAKYRIATNKNKNWNLLQLAASKGYLNLVKYFCSLNLPANNRNAKHSALFLAASNLQIIKFLLTKDSKDGDPLKSDSTGNTFAHVAARNKTINQEYFKQLKKICPSVLNVRNKMGQTALEIFSKRCAT